jgi:hypothetical protein
MQNYYLCAILGAIMYMSSTLHWYPDMRVDVFIRKPQNVQYRKTSHYLMMHAYEHWLVAINTLDSSMYDLNEKLLDMLPTCACFCHVWSGAVGESSTQPAMAHGRLSVPCRTHRTASQKQHRCFMACPSDYAREWRSVKRKGRGPRASRGVPDRVGTAPPAEPQPDAARFGMQRLINPGRGCRNLRRKRGGMPR